MARFLRNSIYSRLFFVFVAVILPLQLMQLAMLRWSRGAIERELNAAASANVEYLRNDFISNLNNIVMQQELIINNGDVQHFFVYHDSMAEAEYFMDIKNIQSTLQLVQYSSPYIKGIELYFLSHGYGVRSGADGSFRTFSFTAEEAKTMSRAAAARTSLINRMEVYNVISNDILEEYYVDYIRGSNTGRSHFLLRAVLNKDVIVSQLASFGAYNDQKAFLINHGSGMLLSSSAAAETVGQWLSEQLTPMLDGKVHSFQFALEGQRYIAVYCYSSEVNSTFVQLIDYDTLSAIPNRLEQYIFAFQVMAAALVLVYVLMLRRMLSTPVRDLLRAFEAAGGGNMRIRLGQHYAREFNQLASHFNTMVRRIQDLIQKDYESTIRVQKAELKQLQAQINPHFLYNSFYLLRHAISQEENDRATLLCDHLGNYFSYIGMRENYIVTLREEYSHALSYAAIQAMRFGEFLRLEIDSLPEALAELAVPRLLLQPLLENAMEYGVPTHGDVALLRIRVRAEGPLVRIYVDDNGNSLDDAQLEDLRLRMNKAGENGALYNIHRRLRIYYGKSGGLTVERSQLGGLLVTMTLGPRPQEGEIGNAF